MSETGLPAQLVEQIKAALEGDSNDAEHDALYAVANEFGIMIEEERPME